LCYNEKNYRYSFPIALLYENMITDELLNYIKNQLRKGISGGIVKNSLIANGWGAADVDEAFRLIIRSNQIPVEKKVNRFEEQPYENRPLVQQPTFRRPFDQLPFGRKFTDQELEQELQLEELPLPEGRNEPMPPQNAGQQPSEGKGFGKAIAVALAIMIIVGLAGYYYYLRQPDVVLRKMVGNLNQIKSLEYSGEVGFNIISSYIGLTGVATRDSNQGSLKFDNLGNFNGLLDVSESGNPQFSLVLFDSLTSGNTVDKITTNFIFGLEMRIMDKVLYFQMTDFPSFGLFDVSSVENQWLEIDQEAMEEKLSIFQFQQVAGGKGNQKEQKLSEEQIQKINIEIDNFISKLAKKVIKMPDEKIEGVNSWHYSVQLDKEELKNLIIKITEIVTDEEVSEEKKKSFDETLKAMELKDIEIWIGKKDNLPHKALISFSSKETEENKVTADYKFTFFFRNYNRPVKLEVPGSTQSLNELFEDLFGGLINNAKNSEIISKMTDFRFEAELIYDKENNFDKLDCSYVGSNVDLKSICDRIIKINGVPLVIRKSQSGSQGYCAYAMLVIGEGEYKRYFCVTDKGESVETVINPSTTCTTWSFRCPSK